MYAGRSSKFFALLYCCSPVRALRDFQHELSEEHHNGNDQYTAERTRR